MRFFDNNRIRSKCIAVAGTGFLLFSLCPLNLNAEEEAPVYILKDFATGTESESYDSYRSALKDYEEKAEDFDNLAIVKDGKVLKAEYAVAILPRDSACNAVLNFTYEGTGKNGSVNGCYGIDAAYVDTSSSGEQATIVLSGARMNVSLDQITLIPIQEIDTRLSVYTVEEGILYHEIKSQMENDNYSYIVKNGKAPAYLDDDHSYYSYDGHYFYEEDMLWGLLYDFKYETHTNAVNGNEPYYNYYQFVSQRTLTNASSADAIRYFADTMGIHGPTISFQDDEKDGVNDTLTRSQYYGNYDAFWFYQYKYGVNALMMMAISANESEYGRSSVSFSRNNLFLHAAYDSQEEAAEARFRKVENSIYSHAKYYISGSFSSPLKVQYNGSFFGNLSAGMNVAYSDDPYWGEKAADTYQHLDEVLQAKDENAYSIAVHTGIGSVGVRKEPSGSSPILYRQNGIDQAFTVIGVEENGEGTWYCVQSDATLDESGTVSLEYDYDYMLDRGYVNANDIQIFLDHGVKDTSYVFVTFDAGEGSFANGESLVTYRIEKSKLPSGVIPRKDGALFTGWNNEISVAESDQIYTAEYKNISSIKLTSLPRQDYELYDRLDLTGGVLTVRFDDGSETSYELTTDMVYGFDLTVNGPQEVQVEFAGYTTSYSIEVSEEKDELRASIQQDILRINELYKDKTWLNDEEKADVLNVKEEIDDNTVPFLTQSQLRTADRIMRLAIDDRIRYVIDSNKNGLQVSGLTLSMPLNDSLKKRHYLEDTYRVSLKNKIDANAEDALKISADFLNCSANESFTLNVQMNFRTIAYDNAFIATINKPEGYDENDVYTVLYYDSDTEDVRKCYTRQTGGTISFATKGNGAYMVISRRTSNTYNTQDPEESLTTKTASVDLEKYRIMFNLLSVALLITAIFAYRKHKKETEIKVQKDREIANERQKDEPPPPVDVTQALQVFETAVINIHDLRKEEDENND